MADALRRFLELPVPDDRIALSPTADAAAARLLVVDRVSGAITASRVADLPYWVRPGDRWVINRSRVRPARVVLGKPTGAAVELLFLRDLGAGRWRAMGETRRLRVGGVLQGPGDVSFTIVAREEREVVLDTGALDVEAWLDRHGRVPLPPYIRRARRAAGRADDDPATDAARYQTVYARERGSIAAPTAGLHFTPALMDAMVAAGARFAEVLLHVGPATFTEVDPDHPEVARVGAESAEIPAATAAELAAAAAEGARVVPVGTTSLRTLEGLLPPGTPIGPGRAEVAITLRPGSPLRWPGAMLTNFHMPRTSLRLLIAAVAGPELALAAYEYALAEDGWRFFSFGDAMLIV
jgi:S-adenosylmethionine:tRNA ribosyltransferase-isomerase